MNLKHIITVLILSFFVCSAASAETANKDLPTKGELTDFTESISFMYDFTASASAHSEEEHPTWKWDLWTYEDGNKSKNVISFYYTDPKSQKGYGSIYYDENGEIVKSMCGVNYELYESYRGKEPVEEEKIIEDTSERETIEEEIEEEVKQEDELEEDETIIKIEYTKNDLKKMDNKERWGLIKDIYHALFGE